MKIELLIPASEIAFYLAYHMKFYGSKPFYNQFLKRDVMVYTDEFYTRVP